MTVPKIIHQMWIGPPLPDHIAAWVETWRDHHPNWVHHWWTEDNLPALRNQSLWDEAEKIAPRAPEQFRSDVARYELLQHFGGVWIDADFECRKPIDEFLDAQGFLVWEVPGRWLANGLFGAEPDHPLLEDLITRLPGNVARRFGQANTSLSGPRFVTAHALRHADRMTFLPKDLFLPYTWQELDRAGEPFPDAYAVHHWNNRRRRLHAEGAA